MKIVLRVIAPMALAMLVACGDKVPESKAAKDAGNVPKQTLDKAVTGVENAMTQSADRLKDGDDKK